MLPKRTKVHRAKFCTFVYLTALLYVSGRSTSSLNLLTTIQGSSIGRVPFENSMVQFRFRPDVEKMDKQLALLYRKSSQGLGNDKKIPVKPHQ